MLALVPELRDFAERVRLADVVDVAVVAVVAYGVIRWLREGAPRSVVVLVGLIAILALGAGALDLYLTQFLLDTVLTVAAVVIVVAFAPEIRRTLERLAAWDPLGTRGRRLGRATDAAPVLDTVASAALRMARERVGALIVMRGREPLEQGVQGGIPLGGRVSEPLLLSIFQPDSPGHDGAVLIEGDRISRFAAHLPLSTNLAEVGRRGTRHTAALGLSERCDALVVVVSEERGEVSVAEGGKLSPMVSGGELKERLERFWWEKHEPRKPRPRKRAWREAGFAALAVALAASLWIVFAYETDVVYRTFTAPVEFRNVPGRLTIADNAGTSATLTIAGSPQAFRRLEPTELVVVVDLAEGQVGSNERPIVDADLDLPSGLVLYDADPAAVRVTLVPRQRASEP